MGMKVEIVNTDCDLPTTVYWIATVIRLAGTFARVTTQIYISTVKTATEKCVVALRGFAKKKNSKNPRDYCGSEWMGPGFTRFFCGKSSQNSPKPVLTFWNSIPRVFYLYTLLEVVGYYDLSVLSMSVMGSKKKVWIGVGGWVG